MYFSNKISLIRNSHGSKFFRLNDYAGNSHSNTGRDYQNYATNKVIDSLEKAHAITHYDGDFYKVNPDYHGTVDVSIEWNSGFFNQNKNRLFFSVEVNGGILFG
ncbi:MAG: hypothetical protein LBR15_11080 [Methanobrevibacter sp.]|jgi:hypothetical protein|nr:hypothetical protein [Candidatus Methanovirga australis]